jgi:hypothetical protein
MWERKIRHPARRRISASLPRNKAATRYRAGGNDSPWRLMWPLCVVVCYASFAMDGTKIIISEVELLTKNPEFLAFLDSCKNEPATVSLDEVEERLR